MKIDGVEMSSYVCTNCGAEYDERVKFCNVCWQYGTLVLPPRRRASEIWARSSPVLSARELTGRRRYFLTSSIVYPNLRFDTGCTILVYGAPGAGKTLFSLKLADGLTGTVLYVNLEEGIGISLVEYLRSLEIRREDFLCVGGLSHEDLRAHLEHFHPDTLVIDSLTVSSLQPVDLQGIQEQYSPTMVITLQVNKEGAPAGSMSLLHIADVVVQVKQLHWQVEKNRFGGLVAGSVLVKGGLHEA